ncbi:MAG: ferrochelatase [Actinobacteria bacterium]|nr:ferrochelatase [Actinomycetota bacterium]
MTVGVLVMAYGTPASPDDVEAYYTHIRHGRPPGADQLADLIRRYDTIGGTSPMAERTRAQVRAIGAGLEGMHPGGFVTTLGQKHAAPFVEDGVDELCDAGVGRIVGVVLAPHWSDAGIGTYFDRARDAASARGVAFGGVRHWHLLPELVEFQAAAVREALAGLPERTKVVLTAHSLPERLLVGDPYPDELRASAEAIARSVGLSPWAGWGLGWQSAGRTADRWRGPDVVQIVRDLAGTGRADGILVVPQGFTSENLEVRYDLDVEAAGVAAEVGLAFGRTRVVDDDPSVMSALAGRIASTVEHGSSA